MSLYPSFPTLEKREFDAIDDLPYESGYYSDGQHDPCKFSGGMDEEEEGAGYPSLTNAYESLPIPGEIAPILPWDSLSVNEFMDYRVYKLKESLKSRGIIVKGKKQDLHCRLVKAIEEKVDLVSSYE